VIFSYEFSAEEASLAMHIYENVCPAGIAPQQKAFVAISRWLACLKSPWLQMWHAY